MVSQSTEDGMSAGEAQDKAQESCYTVHVLRDGYSKMVGESEMQANCTCTLIKGRQRIIVDTMTPWDKDVIVTGNHHPEWRRTTSIQISGGTRDLRLHELYTAGENATLRRM